MSSDGVNRNSSTTLEPDLIQIRAEERRKERLNRPSIPSLPPPRTTTDCRPSTSAKAGLTQRVQGERLSSIKKKKPKVLSPKKIEKWNDFKANKKASKKAAKRSPPLANLPKRQTPIDQPPEVVRSAPASPDAQTPVSPRKQIHVEPPSSPTLSDFADTLLDRPQGAFSVSTTNGSTITFGDFLPIDIDQIDIDNLLD